MQGEFELRSEKARNIIGKTPPSVIKAGMLVPSFVVVVILFILCFIPYPRVKTVSAYMSTEGEKSIYSVLLLEDSRDLLEGQNAIIRIKTQKENTDVPGQIKRLEQIRDSVYVYYSLRDSIEMPTEELPAIEVLIKVAESPIITLDRNYK